MAISHMCLALVFCAVMMPIVYGAGFLRSLCPDLGITSFQVLSLVISWYALSIFFFFNPTMIHGKKNKLQIVPMDKIGQSHYMSAHRGGSMEAIENT